MVLAIAALIVAGVMLFFGSTTSAQKVEETLQEMTTIQAVVRALYGGHSDYTGLSNSVMASSGAMSSKWINGANVVSPFGAVSVVVDLANTNNYDITLYGMPGGACQRIVTSDFGPTLVRVALGSTFAYGGLIPIAAAQTLCPAGSATNIATWIFG